MLKIISLALIGFLSQPAMADVAITSKMSSSGWAGWGASENTTVEMIKGPRSRHETQSKNASVTLTLLDKDVIDQLNVKKKTYTEQSLQVLRDTYREATDSKEGQPSEPQKASPPTHRITRAEFKVTATGQTKKINEFPCKEHLVEMLLEVEEIKTQEKNQIRMAASIWTTPENSAMKQARTEQAAFAQAYMKKLGIDFSPQEMNRFGTQMAAVLTGAGESELNKAMGRLPQEFKKVSGYPIFTRTEWYFQETAPAKTEASTAPGEEAEVDVTHGVTGALTGIASNWAKKKTVQKIEEHAKGQEGKPKISVTMEVQSVDAGPLGDEHFTVPAGYKRVGRK